MSRTVCIVPQRLRRVRTRRRDLERRARMRRYAARPV